MDLEIRLVALEAEVKVLKNEIQNILLEIQEQVLLHYYPSLRAEDDEPSDAVIQALEAFREKRQKAAEAVEAGDSDVAEMIGGNGADPANGAAASPFGLVDWTRDDAAPWRREDSPRTRSALLPPPLPTSSFSGTGVSRAAPRTAPRPAPRTEDSGDWEKFSEMAAWVQDSISRVGSERTTELIEIYVEQGILSASAADALKRVMSLFA